MLRKLTSKFWQNILATCEWGREQMQVRCMCRWRRAGQVVEVGKQDKRIADEMGWVSRWLGKNWAIIPSEVRCRYENQDIHHHLSPCHDLCLCFFLILVFGLSFLFCLILCWIHTLMTTPLQPCFCPTHSAIHWLGRMAGVQCQGQANRRP